MILNMKDLAPFEAQVFLQHAIAPRPIAFASTIDKNGKPNLSPFSFFNLFSSNPPIVIFSPARRVRDNTIKHTLENVEEIPEVVINIVDFAMVQQVSLSSCEFSKEINEFVKAGFTEQKATMVAPPMVKESKVKLECKVLEVKRLGSGGGAGNLVICEVLVMHFDDSVLGADGKPEQAKLDLVARLGGDWYCRANESNLFKVPKPNVQLGIGVDQLPEGIRRSRVLTGNHLGMLANVTAVPAINPSYYDGEMARIVQYYNMNPQDMETEMHRHAARYLDAGKIDEAWQVLLNLE